MIIATTGAMVAVLVLVQGAMLGNRKREGFAGIGRDLGCVVSTCWALVTRPRLMSSRCRPRNG